ncbi:hypothetical protein M422DRAFT_263836 [Sphaerobolus stellatus SS14]|uniref:Uncharacterized protein n=1 Tax=Sphaerobolus stellatus (strain SS14) TaxID=990650 RepID=A0A0C9V996_SPHS4|nr:hypothetical protein M422DRAFT_263836 [Sphaerobolus stellatus SS14]
MVLLISITSVKAFYLLGNIAVVHFRCSFRKRRTLSGIKLNQDAWARHKLFGNDDAPPPQMKGPVALTSADDPAGNENDAIAFLSGVETQPLALHLTNNDPTFQYFSGVHEQDQQAAQILSNAYLQWPDHVVAAIRFNEQLISSKVSDNQDAWELWAALLLMLAWYGKHCVLQV